MTAEICVLCMTFVRESAQIFPRSPIRHSRTFVVFHSWEVRSKSPHSRERACRTPWENEVMRAENCVFFVFFDQRSLKFSSLGLRRSRTFVSFIVRRRAQNQLVRHTHDEARKQRHFHDFYRTTIKLSPLALSVLVNVCHFIDGSRQNQIICESVRFACLEKTCWWESKTAPSALACFYPNYVLGAHPKKVFFRASCRECPMLDQRAAKWSKHSNIYQSFLFNPECGVDGVDNLKTQPQSRPSGVANQPRQVCLQAQLGLIVHPQNPLHVLVWGWLFTPRLFTPEFTTRTCVDWLFTPRIHYMYFLRLIYIPKFDHSPTSGWSEGSKL